MACDTVASAEVQYVYQYYVYSVRVYTFCYTKYVAALQKRPRSKKKDRDGTEMEQLSSVDFDKMDDKQMVEHLNPLALSLLGSLQHSRIVVPELLKRLSNATEENEHMTPLRNLLAALINEFRELAPNEPLHLP